MYGDSFFTATVKTYLNQYLGGFRPHVWGFFFHQQCKNCPENRAWGFRPHVWGFFFHRSSLSTKPLKFMACFRPHVWGFFFHKRILLQTCSHILQVFVPMYGDSFFTMTNEKSNGFTGNVFVPMYGDSFFTAQTVGVKRTLQIHVFVPMYGDSFFTEYQRTYRIRKRCFRPHVWGFFFHKTGNFLIPVFSV